MTAVDHQLVKRFRQEAGDRIAEQRRLDQVSGVTPMSNEDERHYARAVIAQILEEYARTEINSGRTPLDAETEEQYAAAVHAALFGVGRLQPLLDNPEVENIDINGYDQVFVGYANGEETKGDPVAETDEELIELIQILGAYSGLSSRPFDSANPQLDLRLPDGSRLSAVMDVTRRPALSIRRARMGKVFMSDLVGNGTLTPEVGHFLACAVRARKNIMIAGATNAGKTTLLRALANEIPPHERLITVERALELGLDQFADLHPNVVAFEERLPNSEGQGTISMAELVRRSLRMNPSRVIVGEVLGDEIVTMLNAMSQGNDGSLSTIHANSSSEVFNRISTYALQATERLPIEASQMLVAGAVNFVVFIQRRNNYQTGGRLQRMVTSIREVNGVDGRVLSSEVFAEASDGRVVPHAPLACLEDLIQHGYRLPGGNWGDLTMTLAALDSLGSMGGLFSTTVLYALACGIAVGGGLALFAVAVRGLPAKPEHEKQKASERASELVRFAGQRGSIAAGAGIVVLLLTRWAVAGIATAVLVFFWDKLFGGASEEKSAMRRVEALASWTESLRDTIAGAVGLEQAIPASARAAAPVLRPHLDALVDRLRSRTPLPEALQQLADEIDDASADIIVAALILNARLRGPGLRQVLGALAKSAREEVDMRQRVMAQRASTRRSVQIVVAVSVAFVLGLSIFNREFVEPYGTAVGQLVLACVCGLFALGFVWLRKLSTIETPERFLVRDEASVQFVRPRTPSPSQTQAPSQTLPEEGVRR